MKPCHNISLFLLAILLLFQCNDNNVGGDCVYVDIQGYIKLKCLDSKLFINDHYGIYYYYLCCFISIDHSDTMKNCYIKADTSYFNKKLINSDSLFPCIWNRLKSGGCSPGVVKINSIPDTCYINSSFRAYK